MEVPIIKVGVQTVVIKNGSILLGERINSFGSGSWGLPGGHLEIDETILDAGVRELREETNLVAKQVRLFCVTDPDPKCNYHMQIGLEVLDFEGELKNTEPNICKSLRFFEINEIPNNLFVASIKIIENYLEGKIY
jgi:8-oxo-dGTP diphosphatase